MTAAAEILDEDARLEAMPAWRRWLADLPMRIRAHVPIVTTRHSVNVKETFGYARGYSLGQRDGYRKGAAAAAKQAMMIGFEDGAKSMLERLDREGLLRDSAGPEAEPVRYALTGRGMRATRPRSIRRLHSVPPDGVA